MQQNAPALARGEFLDKTSNADEPQGKGRDELFLPDFCSLPMVFALVIMAELLAFVLTLVAAEPSPDRWSRLGLTSLFVQWTALSGAGLLCLLRPALRNTSNTAAASLGYLVLLLTTAVVSEAAYRVLDSIGYVSAGLPDSHAGFLLRSLAIGAIVWALALRYFYVQHQWRRQLKAESEARFQALQSRIRPHFLFNSMNTIASLTRTDPRLAEQVVEDLAELFRASLSDASRTATLAEELTIARQYLRVEQQRLGTRLRVEWDVDGLPPEALVPPLILQPLLENALYHGIEPAPEGGSVGVSGRVEGETVTLTVRNTLPPAGDRSQREGNRLALENIRQRFAAFFESQGKLFISQVDEKHQVHLVFPVLRPRP